MFLLSTAASDCFRLGRIQCGHPYLHTEHNMHANKRILFVCVCVRKSIRRALYMGGYYDITKGDYK